MQTLPPGHRAQICPLVQPDLFGDFSLERRDRVYGRDTLVFAVQGITRPWAMRQLRLSQHFTTRWDELLAV